MGRPAKPVSVLKQEGVSHRTQAELEHREQEEKKLLTGIPIKKENAVSQNKIANTEFNRIRKLMQAIDKDDALYQAVINRYAKITAEAAELEELRRKAMAKGVLDDIAVAERLLTQKRKALLELEKESCMTVAAALRAIPKAPQDDLDEDPLKALLS